MNIQQLSVFVENKQGRLADITAILADEKIDIRALSIADTSDYGILRLIVSNPDAAAAALREEGLTVTVTQVLGVGISDVPGGFSNVVCILADKGISVEYAYAFVTRSADTAYVILRVEDNAAATQVLQQAGVSLIGQQDI